MAISRDEARELAIIALLITAALRVTAGGLQALEELGGPWTVRTVIDRFFAPVGSTLGFATLGAVLIIVLSPNGAVTARLVELCRRSAAGFALIGAAAAVHTVLFGFAEPLTRLWIAMINGFAAAALAGTAYWIMRNFDPER